jgi:hypothetical protein
MKSDEGVVYRFIYLNVFVQSFLVFGFTFTFVSSRRSIYGSWHLYACSGFSVIFSNLGIMSSVISVGINVYVSCLSSECANHIRHQMQCVSILIIGPKSYT